MDSKVNPQRVDIPSFLRSNKALLHQPSLPPLRFYWESWENRKRLLTKRFQLLAEINTCLPSWTQRLNIHIQEQFYRQHFTNQFLVHVVQEGETLTSISKQYGVSIKSIAEVNEEVVNIDLVLKGQHLNIPSFNIKEARKGSLKILDGCKDSKIYSVLSSHHLSPAKTTGYFLLLVPLIAFCIRCIICAFQHRVSEDLKHRVVNKPETHPHGSRSIRWKSVLSDTKEPDMTDADSGQDSSASPSFWLLPVDSQLFYSPPQLQFSLTEFSNILAAIHLHGLQLLLQWLLFMPFPIALHLCCSTACEFISRNFYTIIGFPTHLLPAVDMYLLYDFYCAQTLILAKARVLWGCCR